MHDPGTVRRAVRAARFPLAHCLLLGVVVACQDVEPGVNDAPASAEVSASEIDMAAVPSDSLRLWLEVPDQVRAGESVPVTLRVENVTDRTLNLHLTGRTIAFDLTVADEDGAVVWRRLEDEVVPAILRLETLAPRDTLVLEDTWEQRSNAGKSVAPGAYTMRGELLSEEQALAFPPVPLRILPG